MNYYLFGFPIAHSVSPAFQNSLFEAQGSASRYKRWSTSDVTDEMITELRRDMTGGCAVTMPLKTAIIPHLDEISAESRATGAVNCVVKVRSETGVKLVGTNTDILGIRNALLDALKSQHPERAFDTQQKYQTSASALVVGGGATTKSAIYALNSLGLSPIYLLNRDEDEVQSVLDTFPTLTLIHLKRVEDVDELEGTSSKIVMTVGAIPAIAPRSREERMVYTILSHILTRPYAVEHCKASALPLPTTRLYLEMAYKPRLTPCLRIAAAHGWEPISGTKAMAEQGLAAFKMWMNATAEFDVACGGAVEGEEGARQLVETMGDVRVDTEEVDRAKAL